MLEYEKAKLETIRQFLKLRAAGNTAGALTAYAAGFLVEAIDALVADNAALRRQVAEVNLACSAKRKS